jgi:type IV secretion system protein VirD4
MSPDELKSMPKGSFIVMKTGVHPMRVQLRLFLDWGIRFREPYQVPERAQREVVYASRRDLEQAILRRHPPIPEKSGYAQGLRGGLRTDVKEERNGIL